MLPAFLGICLCLGSPIKSTDTADKYLVNNDTQPHTYKWTNERANEYKRGKRLWRAICPKLGPNLERVLELFSQRRSRLARLNIQKVMKQFLILTNSHSSDYLPRWRRAFSLSVHYGAKSMAYFEFGTGRQWAFSYSSIVLETILLEARSLFVMAPLTILSQYLSIQGVTSRSLIWNTGSVTPDNTIWN